MGILEERTDEFWKYFRKYLVQTSYLEERRNYFYWKYFVVIRMVILYPHENLVVGYIVLCPLPTLGLKCLLPGNIG